MRPELRRAALVRLPRHANEEARHVVFPFNPERLDRRQAAAGTVTLHLSLHLDATAALEDPGRDPDGAAHGVAPVVAALERLAAPEPRRPRSFWDRLFGGGGDDAAPPSLLLVWGEQRRPPVRIVRLHVREETFTPELVPIRARVDLVLRELGADETAGHPAARQALDTHTRTRRDLAARALRRGSFE